MHDVSIQACDNYMSPDGGLRVGVVILVLMGFIEPLNSVGCPPTGLQLHLLHISSNTLHKTASIQILG